MRQSPIAGKEIGGEHQAEGLAIEAHMPMSMPRQMDRPQTLPDVEFVAVVEPSIGGERLEGKERPPEALQAGGDTGPPAIVRMSGVMIGIETWRGDPSAGFSRERRDIENVVEVPVGDDD